MGEHLLKNPTYRLLVSETAHADLDWTKLDGTRIFITGAGGMIGSFIVDVLMERNHHCDAKTYVVASGRNKERGEERFASYLSSPYFEFMEYDVAQPLTIEASLDYIIHAASNTHPVAYYKDAIGTIVTNLIGTKNLLDFAAEHPIRRFCLLSTVEIYGENKGDVAKFSEQNLGYIDSNTLRAGYPESKRCAEALCNAYSQIYGVDFVIPRLCRIYGPTLLSSDSKALSQFIRNAVNGEDIVLKSEGKQFFSYLHVADAVSAVLMILASGENRAAYNVSDSESDIALRDLAQHLADIAQTKVVIQLPEETEKKGFSTATKAILDPSKLVKLGWKAKFDIEEGLRNTIRILKEISDVSNN
jgi:nucleoside-diphosphate-sugar epimerase